MPDLSFAVDGAEPVRFAATPQLTLKLRVRNRPVDEKIAAIVLRCQVQIDARARAYHDDEQKGLRDLFGAPERWGQTLRSILWTQSSVTVPAFTDTVLVDLLLPCSYDFNLAPTKFFHALDKGDIPLTLQFSGSVFYVGAAATLQVMPIAWSQEVAYRLPLLVWKETMAHYYAHDRFLPLHRDVFDRLYRYRVRHELPTWEGTIERLLGGAEEPR
jgi:hypothetical protein